MEIHFQGEGGRENNVVVKIQNSGVGLGIKILMDFNKKVNIFSERDLRD